MLSFALKILHPCQSKGKVAVFYASVISAIFAKALLSGTPVWLCVFVCICVCISVRARGLKGRGEIQVRKIGTELQLEWVLCSLWWNEVYRGADLSPMTAVPKKKRERSNCVICYIFPSSTTKFQSSNNVQP